MLIFNFGICLLEYWLGSRFCAALLKEKSRSNIQLAVSIFLSAAALFLFNQLQILALNPLAYGLVMFLLSSYLFHGKLQTKLAASIFATCLLVVMEFVAVGPLSLLLGDSASNLIATNHYVIVIAPLSKFLAFLCIRLLNHYLSRRKRSQNYRMSFIIMIPVTSLIIMYALLYFEPYLPESSAYPVLICSIYLLLLLVNMIIFHIYDQQQKTYDLKLKLRAMERIQKQQERMLSLHRQHIDELGSLTHDFKNHMISISHLAEKNPEEALHYIESLSDQLDQYKNAKEDA